MPEIVAHSQGSTLYFANAGGIYPNTRPAMWTLILLAYTVGQMVAMHFKYRFQQPARCSCSTRPAAAD